MMRAMSSAVAGLKAQQTGMDVIGNNISNVNTSGFKSSRTTYSDVYYSTLNSASAGTAGTAGGSNASQIGYGSAVASVDVSTGQNGYDSTSSATDCYIDGDGYFVVADATPSDVTDGTGDTVSSYKYTRVGNLTFDSSGNLVNGNGDLICGYTPTVAKDTTATTGVAATTYDGKTQPTTINIKDALVTYTKTGDTSTSEVLNSGYTPNGATDVTPLTISDLSSIAISKDGVISATASDGSTVNLGTIAIANIPNASGLTQDGNSYYKASSGSGTSTYYAAGDSITGSLVTSALETSNVDLASEFANMITTQRGFQANSKIITVCDTMLEELCDMKR
jgi:flagellar hook protein FlgE